MVVAWGTDFQLAGETVLTQQASEGARLVSVQLGKERVIRYLVDSKVSLLSCWWLVWTFHFENKRYP